MRRTPPILMFLLIFVLAACDRTPPRPHRALASSVAPLQDAFKKDSGKVRAIFLASPTCGECIRGALELERAWLDKDSNRNIAVYVVWSPQLGAQEKHVASAMKLVPDLRARHFWDGNELIGKTFQPVLGLPASAWDTWMLFDRGATWKRDQAPTPAWWEHQLSVGPPDRHLDPERFASRAEALESVMADHR